MKITITKTTYSDKSIARYMLIGGTSVKISAKQMKELIKGLGLKQTAKFGGKEYDKSFESYTI